MPPTTMGHAAPRTTVRHRSGLVAAAWIAALALTAVLSTLVQFANIAPAAGTSRPPTQLLGTHAILAGDIAEVGVRANGAFGTASPQDQAALSALGYHPQDSKGLGFVVDKNRDGKWDAIEGDFFVPGSPYEGWALKVGANAHRNNSDGSTGINGEFIAGPTVVSGVHTVTWQGARDGVEVTLVYSLADGTQALKMNVTLRNTTDAAIDEIYWGRGVDPDNTRFNSSDAAFYDAVAQRLDVTAASLSPRSQFYSFNEVNSNPSGPPGEETGNAQVSASFPGGATLVLFSPYKGARASRTSGGFGDFDPKAAWNGTAPHITTPLSAAYLDAGINLAVRVLNLGPGEEEDFDVFYLLSGDDVVAAGGTPPVGATVVARPTLTATGTSGVLTASWDADAGATNGYRVRIRAVGAASWGAGVTVATTTRTFTGLTDGTPYEVEVAVLDGSVTADTADASLTWSTASAGVAPRGPQTITFAALDARSFTTVAFPVVATADSDLAPTFTSTTPSVCTVTSGGTVTLVTVGACTIRASQAGDAAFTAATPVDQSFTVTPATLEVVFDTPEPRTFGTAAAAAGATTLTGFGTSGPTPVVTSTTPSVCTVAANAVTLVSAGECVLTATAPVDARYLPTDAVTRTLTVLPRALTVTGTFSVQGRVYDGTDSASVTSSALTLAGFAAGDTADDVAWTPTARFVDPTAGTGRIVQLVGGAVLTGARGADYVLDVTGAPTATATITARPLTVTGASAATRPYDGTTAVTIVGASLTNVVSGDAVSLAGATAGTAASRDAGTQSVTTAMTLAGADAANYVLTGQPSVTVTITPLPVTATLGAIPPRAYDGTGSVVVPTGAVRIDGLVAGDTVTASGVATAPFRDAGTRTLSLTPVYTPGPGTVLANYVLPSSLTGTVTITPRPVTLVGLRALSRPWDGTTTATLEGGTLQGVIPGDRVTLEGATSGTFAAVTPGTHAVRADVRLGGADAGNYRLAAVPTLSATISRAPATLRITGGLVQFADGSPRAVRAAVSPASAGRVVITYPGGAAPSAPGSYPVTVRLESPTHTATELRATLAIEPLDTLILGGPLAPAPGGTTAGPTPGPTVTRPVVTEERREELLARIAVRTDGTLALPEIGPVLEEDGSAPALAPREHRVLEDGEPSLSRVIVVEEQRVVVETEDRSLALELQASVRVGDERVALPVAPDGTLLLDRGGSVEVGGSGFLAGSTAEVWMFSEATFLGTAVVGPDGSFAGSFPVDDLLAPGEHTIQLNGVGADRRVRSTSLGVRIDDESRAAPTAGTTERVTIVAALADGPLGGRGPLALLALAAALGAAVTRWWLIGRRRRDDEDADDEARSLTGP